MKTKQAELTELLLDELILKGKYVGKTGFPQEANEFIEQATAALRGVKIEEGEDERTYETCLWVEVDSIHLAPKWTKWKIGCQAGHQYHTGGVNGFDFCPYCGKKFSYAYAGPKDKK